MNGYNALVLNSTHLLIADVDVGDPRFDKHAGVEDVDQLIDSIRELG